MQRDAVLSKMTSVDKVQDVEEQKRKIFKSVKDTFIAMVYGVVCYGWLVDWLYICVPVLVDDDDVVFLVARDFFNRKQVKNSIDEDTFCKLSSDDELLPSKHLRKCNVLNYVIELSVVCLQLKLHYNVVQLKKRFKPNYCNDSKKNAKISIRFHKYQHSEHLEPDCNYNFVILVLAKGGARRIIWRFNALTGNEFQSHVVI
uniref:Uncharacterized protein n=1 Tax=Glossina austeni TaxID=7395 RepID=A0A1A9ULV6_GLOAU